MEVGEHFGDGRAQHELDVVEPMAANVGHRPKRTSAFGHQTPIPIGLQQQPVLQIAATHQSGLPQFVVGHHGPSLMHQWVVTLVEAHRMHHTSVLGARHQVRRLCARDTQRFLTNDMLACVDDRYCLSVMHVVG